MTPVVRPEVIVRSTSGPSGLVLVEMIAPGLVGWATLEMSGGDVNVGYSVLSDRRRGPERIGVDTCRVHAEWMRDHLPDRMTPAITIDVDACAGARSAIVKLAKRRPKPPEWLRIDHRPDDEDPGWYPVRLTEDGSPDVTDLMVWQFVPLEPGDVQNADAPVGHKLEIIYSGVGQPFIVP